METSLHLSALDELNLILVATWPMRGYNLSVATQKFRAHNRIKAARIAKQKGWL